eukprot:12233552-Ditylum_brightwellii.AAC.1
MTTLEIPLSSDEGSRFGWPDGAILSFYFCMLNIFLENAPYEYLSGIVYLLKPLNLSKIRAKYS